MREILIFGKPHGKGPGQFDNSIWLQPLILVVDYANMNCPTTFIETVQSFSRFDSLHKKQKRLHRHELLDNVDTRIGG